MLPDVVVTVLGYRSRGPRIFPVIVRSFFHGSGQPTRALADAAGAMPLDRPRSQLHPRARWTDDARVPEFGRANDLAVDSSFHELTGVPSDPSRARAARRQLQASSTWGSQSRAGSASSVNAARTRDDESLTGGVMRLSVFVSPSTVTGNPAGAPIPGALADFHFPYAAWNSGVM